LGDKFTLLSEIKIHTSPIMGWSSDSVFVLFRVFFTFFVDVVVVVSMSFMVAIILQNVRIILIIYFFSAPFLLHPSNQQTNPSKREEQKALAS
jgi:hypothetical protein